MDIDNKIERTIKRKKDQVSKLRGKIINLEQSIIVYQTSLMTRKEELETAQGQLEQMEAILASSQDMQTRLEVLVAERGRLAQEHDGLVVGSEKQMENVEARKKLSKEIQRLEKELETVLADITKIYYNR